MAKPKIQTYVDEAFYEELNSVAAYYGIGVSALINFGMRQWLDVRKEFLIDEKKYVDGLKKGNPAIDENAVK